MRANSAYKHDADILRRPFNFPCLTNPERLERIARERHALLSHVREPGVVQYMAFLDRAARDIRIEMGRWNGTERIA